MHSDSQKGVVSIKIFLDDDFYCHVSNLDLTFREVETNIFDGKCDAYIEGYRFVPYGEIWTREDGVVFTGEMIAPWKPWQELDAAQREYERQLLADYAEALKTLGVTV